MKTIGLITARAGSKGILGKNKKLFAGKPLIEWTLESAIKARMLDRVVVSTDDWEIADIAKRCGAEVPFIRPEALALDDTPHIEVILHALREVGDTTLTHCCLLQPTSPLRNSNDIDEACIIAAKNPKDSVISVEENREYPFIFHTNGSGELVHPTRGYTRRQAIRPRYHVNGAIFVTPIQQLVKTNSVYTTPTLPYIMPKERSMQIDDQFDFDVAEYLMYGILEARRK